MSICYSLSLFETAEKRKEKKENNLLIINELNGKNLYFSISFTAANKKKMEKKRTKS